ncbi:MAG: stage II sporulation protein M [Gemmatimonadales bacterium]|nr:stage II sporulation protein M [Gemmatimonadales bacterium]
MATSPPMPPPSDYRQHLEVETPEHVVLDLEIAGVGSRALAAIIDTVILIGGGILLFLVVAVLVGYGVRLGRWGPAILLLGGFAAWNLYFILFEGLRGGQTPGKRAIGIRVVTDTGHGAGLPAAVARNLLRVADFLPPPYLIGAALAALHPRGKRLGDLVAGTVVVRDRPSETAVPAPQRAAPADSAAPGGAAGLVTRQLSDDRLGLLARFESRARDLPAPARDRLAAALIDRLDLVPPAGVADAEHLHALYADESGRRRGGLEARKGQRWNEFQRLAERAAGGGLDAFAAHELPDFAARYREVAADLARARTYRADGVTLHRLERLVAAGHNALYRDQRQTWRRAWSVITRECPGAVVQARGYVLTACLAFVVPAAAGYALIRERPALAADVLPEVMLQRAEQGPAADGRQYLVLDSEDRPLAASGIIANNVRVAVACFAGGIFLGVGSLVLLAYNGLSIGASAGHFANVGVLGSLLAFIAGHGVLELFAIWVAGAAGFLLGRSVVAPGEWSRADALVLSGRRAVRMVGAAVVLLLVAGIIEGFVSAGGGGLAGRLAVSAGSLAFLVVYLAGGR